MLTEAMNSPKEFFNDIHQRLLNEETEEFNSTTGKLMDKKDENIKEEFHIDLLESSYFSFYS